MCVFIYLMSYYYIQMNFVCPIMSEEMQSIYLLIYWFIISSDKFCIIYINNFYIALLILIIDYLVRSALKQKLPAPAGTFSCSRARCYTGSFLNSATSISGPKSLFCTLLHAPPPTSFTAFFAINVANVTPVKRADVHQTDILNTFVLQGTMMLTSLLRDILMLLTTLFPT